MPPQASAVDFVTNGNLLVTSLTPINIGYTTSQSTKSDHGDFFPSESEYEPPTDEEHSEKSNDSQTPEKKIKRRAIQGMDNAGKKETSSQRSLNSKRQ